MHYACPNCINSERTIGVLQVEAGYRGIQTRYKCTLCTFILLVGPVATQDVIPYRNNTPF